jgi:hypothetical protein
MLQYHERDHEDPEMVESGKPARWLRDVHEPRLAQRSISIVGANERIGGCDGEGLHEQDAPVDLGPAYNGGAEGALHVPLNGHNSRPVTHIR